MALTIFAISAMEVEKKVYYLTDLPTEICDNIASYLIFNDKESDDECIVRTKRYATMTKKGHAFLDKKEQSMSINCSKIIGIKTVANAPQVTTFDIRSRERQENIPLAELSKKNITFS